MTNRCDRAFSAPSSNTQVHRPRTKRRRERARAGKNSVRVQRELRFLRAPRARSHARRLWRQSVRDASSENRPVIIKEPFDPVLQPPRAPRESDLRPERCAGSTSARAAAGSDRAASRRHTSSSFDDNDQSGPLRSREGQRAIRAHRQNEASPRLAGTATLKGAWRLTPAIRCSIPSNSQHSAVHLLRRDGPLRLRGTRLLQPSYSRER